MSTLAATDAFVVNRAGVNYQVTAANLMSTIADTDLFVVNRAAVNYQVTGLDVKAYLGGGGITPPTYLGYNSGFATAQYGVMYDSVYNRFITAGLSTASYVSAATPLAAPTNVAVAAFATVNSVDGAYLNGVAYVPAGTAGDRRSLDGGATWVAGSVLNVVAAGNGVLMGSITFAGTTTISYSTDGSGSPASWTTVATLGAAAVSDIHWTGQNWVFTFTTGNAQYLPDNSNTGSLFGIASLTGPFVLASDGAGEVLAYSSGFSCEGLKKSTNFGKNFTLVYSVIGGGLTGASFIYTPKGYFLSCIGNSNGIVGASNSTGTSLFWSPDGALWVCLTPPDATLAFGTAARRTGLAWDGANTVMNNTFVGASFYTI